jgi:hypothetical protein
LEEVDGGVRVNLWAREVQYARNCSVDGLGGESRDRLHVKVAARHELDVHNFPRAVCSSVSVPGGVTGLALFVDISRTRSAGGWVREDEKRARKESSDDERGEHR